MFGYEIKKQMNQTVIEFYEQAKKFIIAQGHKGDIEWADNLSKQKLTVELFLNEFTWTVINSGFKYQIAKKMYEKLCKYPEELDKIIRHPSKNKAIKRAIAESQDWFDHYISLKTDSEKLDYLETLPHIGIVTKYHLAKSLGMQVAKPDIHLSRISERFGYSDVQQFCNEISAKTGDNIAVVDIVLWRYGEIVGTLHFTKP